MTEGIDVSNNNGGAFDDGAAFAWIKSTEGTSYNDRLLEPYIAHALGLGIPWGAYHFAHPDRNSPRDEANHFLSRPIGQFPMVDVEPRQGADPIQIMGEGPLAAWIDEFCSYIPVQTIIYVNRSYLRRLAQFMGGHPICLATLDGSTPAVYAGRTISVVQHSIVDGIDRDTDLVGYFQPAPTPIPVPPNLEDLPMEYILVSQGAQYQVDTTSGFFAPNCPNTTPPLPVMVDESGAAKGAIEVACKEVRTRT